MRLAITLARGTYAVATAEHRPDDETVTTLHQFTRCKASRYRAL